jgi:hypothetical protein
MKKLIGVFILFALLAVEEGFANPFGSTAALISANMATNQLDSSWTPAWSNLKAYYRMDGKVGALASPYTVPDLSGNSNGTGSGAGLTFAAGRLEQGIAFDGTNYVSIARTSPANVCSNLTIMMWVKWSAGTGYSWTNLAGNFNGSSCTQSGWYMQQYNNTQRMELTLNTSAGTNQSGATVGNVFDGTWRHLVVTIGATQALIYIDGTLDKTNSITLGTGVCSPTAPITLGGPMCDNALKSGAIIDEFAIFDTVLSAGQISTIYNRQKNGVR